MKFSYLVAGFAGSAASLAAFAADPDIQPGMWETTRTVTIESEQFPIPPRTDSNSNCVTAEDIAEGQAFLADRDDCEFTSKEIRADRMDYSMICSSPDGGSVKMDATTRFHGDSMNGSIRGDIESPMGVMKMNVELDGRRIGDC